MRLFGLVIATGIAAVAAIVLFAVFAHESPPSGAAVALIPTHTATPLAPKATPIPHTWPEGVTSQREAVAAGNARPGNGKGIALLSCGDVNHDGRLNTDDGAQFALEGLDIALLPAKSCIDPAHHADFYVGFPTDFAGFDCGAGATPAILVAIGSAGTDLLDATSGESLGLIDIVNAVQPRASAAEVATAPWLAASAVFGAQQAQTAMEQWIEHELKQVLDDYPCLRAVLIGNSHGGVTVTSVTAALDERFGDRMFGVMIDRTIALYDRGATEMPERTPLLNVFQTNEGWHGDVIDAPNVVNFDASAEHAPIAPSDHGGGGIVLVTHKTLDDSPAVQQRIEDAIIAWLAPSAASAAVTPATP